MEKAFALPSGELDQTFVMRNLLPAVIATALISLLSIFSIAQSSTSHDEQPLPSDLEIQGLLKDRVRTLAGDANGVGIVVGVVGPHGRRVVGYGHRSSGDVRPLDGNTVFEIGSVTKVFTALLLAEMAEKGEIVLNAPVTKYLSADVRVPQRNGHPITMVDLATHTSGLPFMPDIVPVYNDPVAVKQARARLYDFLAHYELKRDPGTDWDYSNLGYWLLGEALASRSGMSYEELVQKRVLDPLKLMHTSFEPSAAMRQQLAPGHNAMLEPAPPLAAYSIYGAMPAAGGLLSTVDDLLTFVSVAMGYERSPLAKNMKTILQTRRPIEDGEEQALGWTLTGKGDAQLVMHDGFTWGYASAMAWDPRRRVGVVILSNQLSGVSDIARHILDPFFPLEHPAAAKHVEINLEEDLLRSYAGEYEEPDEGVFQVGRENSFLTIQVPVSWGLPKFRLRPESQRDFFVADLPMRVTFQVDEKGHVSGMLFYPPRGQHALTAKRRTSLH